MVRSSRPHPFKFFKGCLPQNLLSPLLNTLFDMKHLNNWLKANKILLTFEKT